MKSHNSVYLYLHWCPNHHGLLKEVVIESRWMVIQIQHGYKDFGQVVLSLCILRLHIEVILGPHLSIQARPGLCVYNARCRLDQKPENNDTSSFKSCFTIFMPSRV